MRRALAPLAAPSALRALPRLAALSASPARNPLDPAPAAGSAESPLLVLTQPTQGPDSSSLRCPEAAAPSLPPTQASLLSLPSLSPAPGAIPSTSSNSLPSPLQIPVFQNFSRDFSTPVSGAHSTLGTGGIHPRLPFAVHGVPQRRGMFIQTQPTPNPASLKFLPGSTVLPGSTAEYSSARAALASPLAIALFRIDGVSRVFLGSDFVTVTKSDHSSWDVLKPEIFAAIMEFYASGKPVVDASAATDSADDGEGDSEVVEMIKELLETRIRPAVQEDGGDIDFHSFDESTGVVTLRMRGACSGCPSSSVTLKSGVENMLMHYIPEVTSVEQVMEDEEAAGDTPSSGTAA